MTLELPDKQIRKCRLHEVFYVPKLAYNLLSVSKMTDAGKHIMFSDDECHVYDEKKELVAVATKKGNLYYLNFLQSTHHQVNTVVEKTTQVQREHMAQTIWALRREEFM